MEREQASVSSGAPRIEDGEALVRILNETEEYRYKELFRLVRAELQFRRFDGRMSRPITRINFERRDSVGVLLYDPKANTVILVRQFRYPVYAGLEPGGSAGPGGEARAWILEIVAGVQDEGFSVREVAHKELLEEAGYRVKGPLQPIVTIYPSPGGTSERIHLFLGEVDGKQQAGAGGGVAAEAEDTQIVVLPLAEALDRVVRGGIQDAKTIIALQHLALQKARSDAAAGAR